MISQLQEILETHYIESRRHRRYPIKERATLLDIDMEARNIAIGGIQLACDPLPFSEIADRLHESTLPLVVHIQPELAVQARVAYAKREGGEFLIGIEFMDVSEENLDLLNHYVSDLM